MGAVRTVFLIGPYVLKVSRTDWRRVIPESRQLDATALTKPPTIEALRNTSRPSEFSFYSAVLFDLRIGDPGGECSLRDRHRTGPARSG
jgi:hypothetical protein